MTNEVDMDADNIPPGRVTDLQAKNLPDMIDVVKYSSTVSNLTGDNFDKDEFNTEITTIWSTPHLNLKWEAPRKPSSSRIHSSLWEKSMCSL